jgi:hypothetical protein
MSLLDDTKFTDKHASYKMVVYAYSSEEERAEMYDTYLENLACTDIINDNINNQLLTYTNKVETKVRMEPPSADLSERILLEYSIEKHPDELDSEEYYMIAHQVQTAGVVMPYYGTSVVRLGGGVSGTYVTPMRSCNISSEITPPYDTWTHTGVNLEDVNLKWGSVCTGNIPNTTLTGLRTLTHSNGSSPYTNYILDPGALTYADACITKSLEIYTKAKLIKEITNEISYTTDYDCHHKDFTSRTA